MLHALVLATGTGFNGENLSSFPFLTVSQVPHLKRILINTERAGVTDFTIICEEKDKLALLKLVNDKRIQSRIDLITADEKYTPLVEESLVIQANLLIHSSSVEEFIGDLSSKSIDLLSDEGNSYYGLLKLKKAEIKKVATGWDLQSWISKKSSKTINLINPINGYWMNLNNDYNSLKDANNLIFSNVGKTATGWIARNVNGRISLPISRQLVKTPLTPNMISVLINVIGVLTGLFYAVGHPVIGALCMQIATVLDRCDGEVARVKLMETKKGQWVDTVSDSFTVLSMYIGLPIGYYAINPSGWIIGIGIINILFFMFYIVWALYFIAKFTESGSLVSYYDVDKIVDKKNTTIIRKFIALLRPIGRRNVYSIGFLLIAIIGGYPWVFFFASVGILFFFLHVFEDFIKIRRRKRT